MEPLASEVRQPAVAGQFYPGDARRLEESVAAMITPGPVVRALGIVVPHAGYLYSGAVAGKVYGSVEAPDVFVIIGPNHTGMGPSASIMRAGIWKMPGGDVHVDAALAEAILSSESPLMHDSSAHAYEHSIEVQLPFIQHLQRDATFVPIALMTRSPDECRQIGAAVAAAVRGDKRRVLIVASSDMSHYESQESARAKDEAALGLMLALDPEGLLETVTAQNISMCGAAPVSVMLSACLKLGATTARLVAYATSGDVSGDYSQVVGYAGVVIS